MNLSRSKLAIAVLLVFGFSSLAGAANWNLNPVDEPFSMNKTGVNTSTVQLVNLTYDDPETGEVNPLRPEDLGEGDRQNITYYYNASEGNQSLLNHLYGSFWYASFQPNFTRGDMIKYNASGTVVSEDTPVTSGEVVNISEDLGVGNLQIYALKDIADNVKADSRIKLDAAVENASSGTMLTDSEGTVQVSFSNSSGEVASYTLDNFNGENDADDYSDFDQYFYNSEVRFPETTDATYIMTIEATKSSGVLPHGTWSKVVHTLPSIQGEVTELSSTNGCEDRNTVENCEPGAEVSAEYNITASQADSVNVSLHAFNESGRYELKNYSLSESNGVYQGEMDVPDINTTQYMNKVEFIFNATNEERMHIDRRNVTVQPFTINRAGSPTAYTGTTYDMKIFFGKPYSLSPWNKTRFNQIHVNVTDSEGESLENFTMDELEYDQNQGVMQSDLVIESDRPSGAYDIDVNATNIYNRTKTLNTGFSVENLDSTFDIESELTFDVDQLGEENFTVDIESLIDTENELNITQDLPDEINVTNETAQLSSREQGFLNLEVDLEEMEDASGSFKVSDQDTGYNRTVEVDVDAAECHVRTGNLCSTTEEWINITTGSTAEIAREIELLHLRPDQANITFNASVSGEVSDYLEIDGETENIEISDSRQISLLYNPGSGVHTGKIILESEDEGRMEIQTELNGSSISGSEQDSGSSEEQASFTVERDSVDIGYIPAGDSTSAVLTVVNDGDTSLDTFSVDSDTYSVTVSGPDSLESGSSADLSVTFDEIQSESGEVTVSAADVERTVSVSANPVPNYADRTADLESRLTELQGQVESSDLETQLTGVSTKISKIQTAWTSGDYEEAETLYSEVDGTLSTVNAQVSSEGTDTGQSGESSGGGTPILMVAVVIFLLLIVGFVFYTSYIPEKGDPLYDVLGEE